MNTHTQTCTLLIQTRARNHFYENVLEPREGDDVWKEQRASQTAGKALSRPSVSDITGTRILHVGLSLVTQPAFRCSHGNVGLSAGLPLCCWQKRLDIRWRQSVLMEWICAAGFNLNCLLRSVFTATFKLKASWASPPSCIINTACFSLEIMHFNQTSVHQQKPLKSLTSPVNKDSQPSQLNTCKMCAMSPLSSKHHSALLKHRLHFCQLFLWNY